MRLFVAVNFPPETVDAISALQGRLRGAEPRGSWSRRENLHLTLAFLGEQPRERLDAAAKELYDVDQFTDMIADETICTEDPEQLLEYLTSVGHPVLSMEPFDM